MALGHSSADRDLLNSWSLQYNASLLCNCIAAAARTAKQNNLHKSECHIQNVLVFKHTVLGHLHRTHQDLQTGVIQFYVYSDL